MSAGGARLVDFAAARRQRGLESVEDVAARHVDEVKRYLAEGRERLRPPNARAGARTIERDELEVSA